jgi:hypothetical protein
LPVSRTPAMKQFQEFALIASVLIPAITKISGDIQRKIKHLKSTDRI